MNLFFRDSGLGLDVSWERLIEEINQTRLYNPYCFSADCYSVFKHVILSLILGREIILLDADFTEIEIKNLTGFSHFEQFDSPVNKEEQPGILSKDHLFQSLEKSKQDWKITLFSSGTTGLPKQVAHGFSSICRFIKKTRESDVWGFAYNPTHIAGLQVFFQAFFNGNTIIRLFDLPRPNILSEISTYGITHISATPTFFRLLLPVNENYPSVKRITSGGEKFDSSITGSILSAFPNARITNVYATTEAGTLFASEGEIFTIKPEILPFLKIESDELFVHRHLTGDFKLQEGEWFATGDLVELLGSDPVRFRFQTRKHEMINVGGYKVNPHEVEDAIRTIPGILDVRIFGRKNSVLGNVVCCEVVVSDSTLTETSVRQHLQTLLQEYKIPRSIQFVSELSTTRTGKTKR